MSYAQTIIQEILKTLHVTTGTLTLGTLTITAPNKIRLKTANGTASVAGTELSSGGSYVAGTGLSIGSNWAAPSGTSQSTNGAVSQANMPAGSIVGIEIYDSSATPKRLEYGSMTTKTTQAGDTLTFTAGALTSAMA